MLKFIILSDLHIVPEGRLSHGLDTLDRLNQAIDHVNARHDDAAFVICAGDLADHGEAAAYERLGSALGRLTPPVRLTLGNHDHRPTFLDVFGEDLAGPTGQLDHVIDAEGHRIVVLDSSEPDLDGAGRLTAEQLQWLGARLNEAADRPVVIVLHHNITPFHIQTDFIMLEEADAFLDVVRTHPDIRQVISGHVHLTSAGTVRGVPFCTLGGGHYSIEPMLESRSGPVPGGPVPRREGPGELAVVLCDDRSTVVHMERFLDRHLVLAPELFPWIDGEG
ncbi:MAG: metallophosphoesterase [Pseudomonadota bacterium]